ncbi:hypothetical protein LCGC14_0547900 [marine sediment metagenome]|uniref:Uncharacterized protein n=1 Tax=marine sediment metagenome TaxID=412755 RepID=A0A0F9UZ51_9ZZZZ
MSPLYNPNDMRIKHCGRNCNKHIVSQQLHDYVGCAKAVDLRKGE